VLIGAQPAAGWPGIVAVLAAPVFFAGGVAATLAAIAGQAAARRPLAAALVLETLLLAVFAAAFAARPPSAASAVLNAAAALCGLAAMGVQSAAVRLLMRGTASTNVMTTATSQLAIDATQVAWACLRLKDGSPETVREIAESRRRLWTGAPLPLAFLLGTLLGAVGFGLAGAPVLAAPAALAGALAWWAGWWEGRDPARG
jgi:uncharacterized membrane protein YoaK (UPF0700 family)